jgi:hypothetical protein
MIIGVTTAWINAGRYPSQTTITGFLADVCLPPILLTKGASRCPKTAGAHLSSLAARAGVHASRKPSG